MIALKTILKATDTTFKKVSTKDKFLNAMVLVAIL